MSHARASSHPRAGRGTFKHTSAGRQSRPWRPKLAAPVSADAGGRWTLGSEWLLERGSKPTMQGQALRERGSPPACGHVPAGLRRSLALGQEGCGRPIGGEWGAGGVLANNTTTESGSDKVTATLGGPCSLLRPPLRGAAAQHCPACHHLLCPGLWGGVWSPAPQLGNSSSSTNQLHRHWHVYTHGTPVLAPSGCTCLQTWPRVPVVPKVTGNADAQSVTGGLHLVPLFPALLPDNSEERNPSSCIVMDSGFINS